MITQAIRAALLVPALAVLAGAAAAQTLATATKSPPVPTRTVKLLPPDVSRSLQLLRMPGTPTTPLLVGVYWNCQESSIGTDFCRLVTVVCTQDQSLCAEV